MATEPPTSATIYFDDIREGDVFGSPDITITVDRGEMLDHNRYETIGLSPSTRCPRRRAAATSLPAAATSSR